MTSLGEMRITLVPLADDGKDPSIYKVQDRILDAESSIGVSSSVSTSSVESVHSAMKLARTYDLMVR